VRRATVVAGGALLVALAAVALVFLARRAPALPPDVEGAIVFVSTRDGPPALYWRRLPRSRERTLVAEPMAAEHPAIAPDGTRVAFESEGRIAIVAVATGEVRHVTTGVGFQDAEPAWMPDGRRLVVSSRRGQGAPAGLHLLDPSPDGGPAERHPLTQPLAGEDHSPAPSPDGAWVLFVRGEHLMRVDLADGSVRRLTGGFRRERSPRFLEPGRIVCAWSEGKTHGIDVLDTDGRGRRTVVSGQRYHSTIAPSPDGRYLVATVAYDLGRNPLAALLGAEREELHLLDLEGRDVAVLEASSRHANRSADWGR
jgi:Tol biopolymer transport system component